MHAALVRVQSLSLLRTLEVGVFSPSPGIVVMESFPRGDLD